MDHLAPEVLLHFVDGSATREEVRSVVRHLLRGCAECGSILCLLLKSDDEVFNRCLSWNPQQKS